MAVGKLRIVTLGVAGAVVLSGTAAAAPSTVRRGRAAVRYIVRQQESNGSVPAFSTVGSTSDAALAMVAARRGAGALDDAVDFLRKKVKRNRVKALGEKAKVALAAVASGRDPRSFGGHNLVAEIRATRLGNGRFSSGGDGLAVISHALALLALEGAQATIADAPYDWLARAQCDDGGWQYDRRARAADNSHCLNDSQEGGDFTTSDSNTTAYAVQALIGAPASVASEANPFDYFALARDEVKRGWRYSHKRRLFGQRSFTDANSTALVLQAFAAEGKTPPRRGHKALARLQYKLCGRRAGSFAYTWEKRDGSLRRTGPDVGATIGAVPGILGRSLPLAAADVTKPAPSLGDC